MLVARKLQPIDGISRLVLTIGVFDGMHRGHRAVLSVVRRRARALGAKAAVLTFVDHPSKVLSPARCVKLLTSPQHRLFLLEEAGVEVCFLTRFTKRFSHITPDLFVRDILSRRLSVAEVWLGTNARFGHRRAGTPERMRELAVRGGFRAGVVGLVGKGSRSISSTWLRHLVERGNLRSLARLLGRPYEVFGTPVRGDARGRKLGIPTANLDVQSEVMPPKGVYAVWAEILDIRERAVGPAVWKFSAPRRGKRYRAVLNYGTRPTFYGPRGPRVTELHLLGFSGHVRGACIRVLFCRKLRQEKKFESQAALATQINKDIRLADTYLKESEHGDHEAGA